MKTPHPRLHRASLAATAVLALSLSVAGAVGDDPPAQPAPAAPPASPAPAQPSGEPAPQGEGKEAPPAPAPEPAADDSADKPKQPATPIPDAGITAPGLDESDPRNDEVEATVTLTTGERVTGVLLEDKGRSVTVRVGGIATTFTADQIDQVSKSAPFRERYKLFSESAGSDPDQILKVADWLAARERYELALYEVERALAVQPGNNEAKQRQLRLTKQLELADRARRSKSDRSAQPAAAPDASPRRKHEPAREDFPLLTPDQVNIMRVYEVNLNDPPNMVIERSTVQRLIDAYAGNPLIPVTREGREAFFRKRPAEILDIMFRLRAREFYGEVRVLESPESIRRFRDDVERTWLTNACATTDCHGGASAGRLQLATRRTGSDAAVATNLLILDRFKLSDGTPLLDYDRPERSPLLQFALPRADAWRKHPPVRHRVGATDAVKPVFRDTNDRRFQLAVAWMKSMYSPRPEYPITYIPPGEASAPSPAPGAQPGSPNAAPSGRGGTERGVDGGGGSRPEADKTAPSEQPKR